MCTETAHNNTATKGTWKASSCIMEITHGNVTGYKDVSTGCEHVLMSTVAQQPVPIFCETEQSSFQLYSSDVLWQPDRA